MTELFSKYAPAYWAKGISVIPLHPAQKRPVYNQWTEYCTELPSEYTQNQWLKFHKNSNIGVALGSQSNMVVIDIDSIDPVVEKAILSCLPKSPWKRVGAKGCVLAYRYNGEDSKNIKDENGKMLVEIISSGRQVVLPPSIHPDTNEPYVANCDLLEVYDDLPKLPENTYERIRSAILAAGVKLSEGAGKFKMLEFQSSGARDVSMTRYAGLLSFSVLKGELSLNSALNNMTAWCNNLVQQVAGDNIDINKGLSKVIEFVKSDVARGKVLPVGWDAELTPEQKIKWGLNFSEMEEDWPVAQINDYIFAKFSETDSPSDPRRQEVIKFVLRKLAKTTQLDKIEIGQVLQNLKKSSGLELPLTYYTQELKALKAGPIEGVSHNQIADAVMALWEERSGKLVFTNDKFWQWNGCHWEIVGNQKIWSMITEEYGELAAAKRASDHKGIIQVLQNKLPQNFTPSPVEGVNFLNGFLTKELKLLDHQPEFGCTYVLPYSYKPELAGKCSKFFQYLMKSWGDDDDFSQKVEAFREAMAVTMFGIAPSFQRCFLLYGPGGTGKSVALDIIEQLVPEGVREAVSPEQWGEKFTPSMFANKLLNRAGELHEKKNISSAIFKQIVDGSPIKAEFKNGQPFTFESKCAHWFASNHLPHSSDTSSGFSRRWLILSFDKVIPEEEKIIEYGKIIVLDEMEAIVAWVVESLPNLLSRGHYTLPESHTKLSKMMDLSNSHVRAWFEERIMEEKGGKTKFPLLWNDFWAYCSKIQTKVLPPAAFRRELQQILQEQSKLKVVDSNSEETYINLVLRAKK